MFCTDIDMESMQKWIEREDYASAKVGMRKLDVRQPAEWKSALDEASKAFGDIDVVINVAGYLRPGRLHETGPGEVDMHVDVNVKGVMFGTRIAARKMVDQGFGHIINVGSLASLTPVPGLSLYAGSKFAVRGFSLSAAQELREHGVDVSVVLLDAVDTPMLELQADYEEAALTFSGKRPLTLDEVEKLICEEVLVDRPLEMALPKSRGVLAALAGLVPEIHWLLGPLMEKLGRRAQDKYKPSK